MVTDVNWEFSVYDEILAMYEKSMGIDLRADPIIYHKVIELMELMKDQYSSDPDKLRDVVTNSIILILTLFFDRKPDDFDDSDEMKLSEKDRNNIKAVLSDALSTVSSGSE
jgi:hypothetical protein